MFVSDHANVLVKVVAIFDVIKRVGYLHKTFFVATPLCISELPR